MGLPRAIVLHLSPVKDLLMWLQVVSYLCIASFADSHIPLQRLSSISDFSDLVATIQAMKSLNPLQVASVLSFVNRS